jgi:hypothetical protein
MKRRIPGKPIPLGGITMQETRTEPKQIMPSGLPISTPAHLVGVYVPLFAPEGLGSRSSPLYCGKQERRANILTQTHD